MVTDVRCKRFADPGELHFCESAVDAPSTGLVVVTDAVPMATPEGAAISAGVVLEQMKLGDALIIEGDKPCVVIENGKPVGRVLRLEVTTHYGGKPFAELLFETPQDEPETKPPLGT